MIAATYAATGGSDVLSVGEVQTPAPGPGEVLVRLAVAGVNPTDWKSRAGTTGDVAFAFQVPGQDGAGVVEAVGEGVAKAWVGERVWVYFAAWKRQWGTAAQYTVVPVAQAVPLPAEASFELGASLGIPALTAYHCLFADGPLDGRRVLVAGGAGAVGHAAIELARWGGAEVVTTVSSDEKAELAGAADLVVNYREPGAAERIGKVDRIVEVALGPNLELDLAVANPHTVISTYAADVTTAEVPIRQLMTPNLVLRFVLVYTIPDAALHAAVDGVSRAVGGRRADHAAAAPLPTRGDRRRPRRRRGRSGRQGRHRNLRGSGPIQLPARTKTALARGSRNGSTRSLSPARQVAVAGADGPVRRRALSRTSRAPWVTRVTVPARVLADLPAAARGGGAGAADDAERASRREVERGR